MRATWPPEDAAWLRANPHGLPPIAPYSRYWRVYDWPIPGHKTPSGPKGDPWNTPNFKAYYGGTSGHRALIWLWRCYGQRHPAPVPMTQPAPR